MSSRGEQGDKPTTLFYMYWRHRGLWNPECPVLMPLESIYRGMWATTSITAVCSAVFVGSGMACDGHRSEYNHNLYNAFRVYICISFLLCDTPLTMNMVVGELCGSGSAVIFHAVAPGTTLFSICMQLHGFNFCNDEVSIGLHICAV